MQLIHNCANTYLSMMIYGALEESPKVQPWLGGQGEDSDPYIKETRDLGMHIESLKKSASPRHTLLRLKSKYHINGSCAKPS